MLHCDSLSRFGVGFDLAWLVLIRPRWFQIAAVGFPVLRLLVVSPVFLLLVSPLLLLLLVSPLLLGVSPLLHLAPALLHGLIPLLIFSVSFPPSLSSSFPRVFVVVSRLICVAPHIHCFWVSFGPGGKVRGVSEGGIAKTNHDLCRGSYFVTHQRGIPIHGCPLSSSLPRSSFEQN
jgi:hypothetical protein